MLNNQQAMRTQQIMHGFAPTLIAQQTHEFMGRCANAMLLCAESAVETNMVKAFLQQSQHPFKQEAVKTFSPNPLPCLDNLQWVKDMKLAKDFQKFARYLPWGYSPRTLDRGKEVAIMDFSRLFAMDTVGVGLMYVDVEKSYPLHNHPPHEMYFIISGSAQWRWGGHDAFRNMTAGNLLYNHPYNWHGVVAGSTPVLALYIQVA